MIKFTRIFMPVALASVFAGSLILFNCSSARTPSVEAQGADAPDAPAVAVAKAKPEEMSNTLALTAEFRPFQEIDVMAKVAGYVKSINVDVGDRVQQGQLLAVLEIPEMADDQTRAQAALDRSQAEVARAADDLRRAQSSHENVHLSYTRLSGVAKQRPGLVAQQELDDAHGKDLVAEAQISAAQSNHSAAEQQARVSAAELQRVRTLLDYAHVAAPFAGVITKRYADTGSMIQAGTSSSTQVMPLVKLSDNSMLRLVLPVPESAVPTVNVGQTVEVHVPTLGRSFPGRVARSAGKVLPSTRTMDTEIDVPNPGLRLIPGMYAEVKLTLDHRSSVLAIPIPAVDFGGDEASGQVAVVTPENRVEMRKVALGIQTATSVEVRSGLNVGDLVVMGNRASLRAGQQVRPRQSANAGQVTP